MLLTQSTIKLRKQFPADLVTFTEEILNGKLHFMCSDTWGRGLIYRTIFVSGVFHTSCFYLMKDEWNKTKNNALPGKCHFTTRQ